MELVYYIVLPFVIFLVIQFILCMKSDSIRIRLIPVFVSVFMILLGLINLLGEANPLPVDVSAVIGVFGSMGIACLFGCGCGWAAGVLVRKMTNS